MSVRVCERSVSVMCVTVSVSVSVRVSMRVTVGLCVVCLRVIGSVRVCL